MNPAADAQPMQDVQGDGRWMSQHKRFLTDTKREPEVLFIGDSLIQNLARTQLWKRMFEPLHCLNFGIGGDQTQHVLWRVQNGELENLEPKGIPPRGEKPNPLRIKIKEINDNLAMQLDDIENCTFLATDPSMYVDAEGKISAMDMYDYLHLTSRGYQKLCDPLLELAQDLLQEFVKVENTSQDSDSLAGDLATKAP
ncbi:PA1B2-like protein [Mya arenaria]|uniref:PA1B2-like protein n=1 Tax=Mya arenaria TaxID=6604 RepID=A0ABY7EBL5_MYAAR|nr:PA1B2-like protein [Mya arenaria]